MMTDEDWASSGRLLKITDDIIRLLRDTAEEEFFDGRCEGYEAGVEESQMASYDEGYEAGVERCQMASYDEGYDTAMTNFEADLRIVELQRDLLNDILSKVEDISNNIVVTPETPEQLSTLIADFSDNGAMCAIAVANYVKNVVKLKICGISPAQAHYDLGSAAKNAESENHFSKG